MRLRCRSNRLRNKHNIAVTTFEFARQKKTHRLYAVPLLLVDDDVAAAAFALLLASESDMCSTDVGNERNILP